MKRVLSCVSMCVYWMWPFCCIRLLIFYAVGCHRRSFGKWFSACEACLVEFFDSYFVVMSFGFINLESADEEKLKYRAVICIWLTECVLERLLVGNRAALEKKSSTNRCEWCWLGE